MNITKKELLELALMGMDTKIEQKAKSIVTGERLITKMRMDCRTTQEKYEATTSKVQQLKQELEDLYKYKENLIWFDEIDELKII